MFGPGTNTTLPGLQEELALKLLGLGKPTVVVLLNGGIVSTDRLAAASTNCALVEAFNPGIRGGEALAKSLFGIPGYNRFGKLPVTIYDSSFSDSVEMIDMSFTAGLGRSYKYWTGPPPLFEFGHGMSLTTFKLSWAGDQQPPATAVVTAASIGKELITVHVALENTGIREGDEVLMLYHIPGNDLRRPSQEAVLRMPHRRLLDFERISLSAHAGIKTLQFQVNATSLGLVDSEGNTYLYAGSHQLRVDTSPDSVAAHNGGSVNCLTMNVTVDLKNGPLLIDTLL